MNFVAFIGGHFLGGALVALVTFADEMSRDGGGGGEGERGLVGVGGLRKGDGGGEIRGRVARRRERGRGGSGGRERGEGALDLWGRRVKEEVDEFDRAVGGEGLGLAFDLDVLGLDEFEGVRGLIEGGGVDENVICGLHETCCHVDRVSHDGQLLPLLASHQTNERPVCRHANCARYPFYFQL